MKKHKVFVIQEAEDDLINIFDYITEHDSKSRAIKIIDKIEKICYTLRSFPERGRIVPELKNIKINQYLELISKPYRIIYQVKNNIVFIHAILDSRRDLEELLYDRLIKK